MTTGALGRCCTLGRNAEAQPRAVKHLGKREPMNRSMTDRAYQLADGREWCGWCTEQKVIVKRGARGDMPCELGRFSPFCSRSFKRTKNAIPPVVFAGPPRPLALSRRWQKRPENTTEGIRTVGFSLSKRIRQGTSAHPRPSMRPSIGREGAGCGVDAHSLTFKSRLISSLAHAGTSHSGH